MFRANAYPAEKMPAWLGEDWNWRGIPLDSSKESKGTTSQTRCQTELFNNNHKFREQYRAACAYTTRKRLNKLTSTAYLYDERHTSNEVHAAELPMDKKKRSVVTADTHEVFMKGAW